MKTYRTQPRYRSYEGDTLRHDRLIIERACQADENPLRRVEILKVLQKDRWGNDRIVEVSGKSPLSP